MDNTEIKPIIEALLLSADRPLSVDTLRKFWPEEQQPDNKAILAAIEALQEDIAERAYEIKDLASGYRLQVKQAYSAWIIKLWEEKPPKYSRATLETLAIIAYRQPVTRSEIEDIRGVAVSSHIMKALQEREWIKLVGHRDVPGKPGLYATTKEFLDYFNLKSLDDLPTLAEIKDLDQITESLTEQLPEHEQQTEQTEHAQTSSEQQLQPTPQTDPSDVEPEAELQSTTELEFNAQQDQSIEHEASAIEQDRAIESEHAIEPNVIEQEHSIEPEHAIEPNVIEQEHSIEPEHAIEPEQTTEPASEDRSAQPVRGALNQQSGIERDEPIDESLELEQS